MPITRRGALLTAAASLALARRARAAETIRIGVVSPLTGPAAQVGAIQLNSCRLAAEEINAAGGVLGKQVELVVEDDQTTNPGVVLAFSRLAADPSMVGFIGSIRSTQVNAMAPDVAKVGKPMMFGGTDPKLTHSGYHWLFRCRPNDSYSGRVIADFGVNTLGKKNWVVLHSTDAFGTGGQNSVTDALQKLGATIALDQGYANQQADFTPVVLAIRQSGAEAMASYFTYEPDIAVFARQLRQLGVRIPWVGSQSIASPVTMGLAKNALYGAYGVADFLTDANPEAVAFTEAYRKKHPESPDSGWTYDALHILAKGINDAGGTEPEKIRAAILAIKGYKGTEGTYNFDENGDGLHGYNVEQNIDGKSVFMKRVEFPG
jgi:branched-chain amino acid transport system substrate-binding protein